MFQHDERCFGCGEHNAAGLRLRFGALDDQSISATFATDERYVGPPGLVHGGILATLLDEALARLPPALGIVALTSELHVRYRRRVRPGTTLCVVARVVARSERRLALAARLTDESQQVVAEADAVFQEIDPASLRG